MSIYLIILTAVLSSILYLGVAAAYHVIIIGFFALVLLTNAGEVSNATKSNPILKLFIYWTLYALISIVWAKDRKLSMQYTYYIFLIYMYSVIFVRFISDRESFFKTVRFINLITLTACFVGLWEMETGKHLTASYLETADRMRIFRFTPAFTFYNPNDFAIFLFLFLPFSFYEAIYGKNLLARAVGLLNIPMTILVVGVTNSRTILICVIVYTAVMTVKYFKHVALKLVVCALVFFLAIQLFPGLDDAFDSALSDIGKENLESSIVDEGGSGETRVLLFLNCCLMMISSCCVGVGAGCHRTLMKQYSAMYFNTGRITVAHNFIAEFLADYGLLMFGIAVYILYRVGKKLLSISRENRTKNDELGNISYFLFWGLLLFPVASITISSLIQQISLWTFFGIIAAFWNIRLTETKNASEEG